jgi:hypothetical protein
VASTSRKLPLLCGCDWLPVPVLGPRPVVGVLAGKWTAGSGQLHMEAGPVRLKAVVQVAVTIEERQEIPERPKKKKPANGK